MTRSELLSLLAAHVDPAYRTFSAKLLPADVHLLGVRLPLLHKFAREIVSQDPAAFLREPCGDLFEERMVRSFVIARLTLPAEEKIPLIREFLPLIDNWSVCDSFCAALRDISRFPEDYFTFAGECLRSKDCYTLRFGLVLLTDHYLNDRFIDQALRHFFSFSHPEYYARMAAAWGISIAYLKYPDKTAAFLRKSSLDPFTHNTAIRKIRESKRAAKEQKEYVKTLRR